MNRKDFLIACGYGCLGMSGFASMLQGCTPALYIEAKAADNIVKIPLSAFGESRKYLVVRVQGLSYPIAVFKSSDANYTALLLQCSHQGTEVTVNGEIITCPAHGSEFSTSGEVIHGPAEEPLPSYRITTDQSNIHIHIV